MFFLYKSITPSNRSFEKSEQCVYLWKALSIWALRGLILPVGILTEFFLFGGVVLTVTHGKSVFLGLRQFVMHDGQSIQVALHCICSGPAELFFQYNAKTKSIDFSCGVARYYYSVAMVNSHYFINCLVTSKKQLFHRLLGGQLTVVLNE